MRSTSAKKSYVKALAYLLSIGGHATLIATGASYLLCQVALHYACMEVHPGFVGWLIQFLTHTSVGAKWALAIGSVGVSSAGDVIRGRGVYITLFRALWSRVEVNGEERYAK